MVQYLYIFISITHVPFCFISNNIKNTNISFLFLFHSITLLFCCFFRSNSVPANDLDSNGSITSIQTALDKLATQRDELGDLWATRKLRLDLCLQLRIFERDALEVAYL